jgi:hypothetical protein
VATGREPGSKPDQTIRDLPRRDSWDEIEPIASLSMLQETRDGVQGVRLV